ncbi:MAG: DNA polymerase III subunit delta' [Vicinamibacterales bacterium]
MPFRDLVGHGRQLALLSGAVARGSVPGTLLFAGPAGVGKWRVARALAQAVNCAAAVAGDACGTCRACDRIARDAHVDVLTLAPDDGAIKIDPVRDVLSRCGFRPFEGQRRVVAIRDADALTEGAQNALLKSLEEPPPGTMFVLTSAAPDALLRTVRSRTMRLTFGRLPTDDLVRLLVRDHDHTPDAARRAAALADGSVAAALALGSADVAAARAKATRLLRAATLGDVGSRLAVAKDLVGKPELTRQELVAVLRVASSLTRDLALVHAGADRGALANGDAADLVDRLAAEIAAPAARRAFATIDRGLGALTRNAGIKVVADWVVTEL